MTVKELKEILDKYPDDATIILGADIMDEGWLDVRNANNDILYTIHERNT